MNRNLSGSENGRVLAVSEQGPEQPPAVSHERQETPPEPVTVVEPPCGWRLINVRELWCFRELIFFLAWRDVKVRYKQTVLGAAWAVLQPALMMAVFTIFFGRMGGIAAEVPNYPLFVLAGLLPWGFFSAAVTYAGNSVLASERLITKIYLPRLAVPLASVGVALLDFVVACSLLGVVMAIYRVPVSWNLLLAPVIFAIIALTAVGLGSMLAALNVAYRDFRYVVPFLLQLWMFATPTIYMPIPATPSPRQEALLLLNPLTGLIAAFRAATLGDPIHWGQMWTALVFAVVVFVVGCFYFRKVEDGFADLI